MKSNPATDIKTPKREKRLPVYLNLDESRELLSEIAGKYAIRDKAILTLFLSERAQRISNRAVQALVKKRIGKAGLDTEKYSTHKLRHTAATLMYKHGHVDIRALQAILGHESISTTEIYTHVDDEQLRTAVNSNPLNMEG